MVSLETLKTVILGAVGTFVIIVLVVRMATAYAKKQWGELVTEVAAAVVVFYACFFTDNFVAVIKQIGQGIFGPNG